jgi:acetyl-CoA carboxylase carboxyl transferase subunit alpha
MYKNKLIDKIIKEPFGGAHYNPEEISVIVKKEILNSFKKLQRLSTYKLISNRRERFYKIGRFST